MILSTPNIKYCNLYWHFWYLFADYFSSKHFLGRSFQFALKLFQLNVTVFPPTIVAHNKILFVIWYMREALSWYKTYLVAIFFLLISLLFVVKIVLMACGVLYKRSFFRKLGYFCQLVTMQFMIVTARQIMQLNWAIVNTHLYFLRNLNFQSIQD